MSGFNILVKCTERNLHTNFQYAALKAGNNSDLYKKFVKNIKNKCDIKI